MSYNKKMMTMKWMDMSINIFMALDTLVKIKLGAW